jgi:hypothetical protein
MAPPAAVLASCPTDRHEHAGVAAEFRHATRHYQQNAVAASYWPLRRARVLAPVGSVLARDGDPR